MQGWNSQSFVKLRGAHLRQDVKGTLCESGVAFPVIHLDLHQRRAFKGV